MDFLPCPHCKSSTQVRETMKDSVWYVSCNSHSCQGSAGLVITSGHKAKDMAVKDWNEGKVVKVK